MGKSAWAVALAEQLGASIICMDSRQVYSGFCIGTAQPSPEQRARVPHHLVNFLEPTHRYSAAQFALDAKGIAEKYAQSDFILVGGTGLYLKALSEGLVPTPPTDETLRHRLAYVLQRKGLPYMYQWALRVDSGISGKLDAGNTHRVLRVLELHLQGAPTWSQLQGQRSGGIGALPVLWLDRPRAQLYARIDARVQQMLAQGWIDEVKHLRQLHGDTAVAMQSLGYKQIAQYLDGALDYGAMVESIAQETRRYAKRQITWFGHQVECSKLELTDGAETQDWQGPVNFFKNLCKHP